MKIDTRSKNVVFSTDSVFKYLSGYAEAVNQAIQKVDPAALEKAFSIIKATSDKKGTIYVAGNGGSSAISDHLCCDFTKGTYTEGNSLKTFSLTAHTALLTAIANDFSYDESFAKQVEMLAGPNDCLILISSSGNSPNVVAAAKTARDIGMKIIGLTGFAGGALGKASDAHLHVPFNNYGVVEDCHQSLMHILAQYLYLTSVK
jgi:D-sedoheptulose 7-phosphate isomerase